MNNVAPLLPYADLPSQYGIVVERSPTALTIKVPRSSLWRRAETFVFGWFATLFLGFFGWAILLGVTGRGSGTAANSTFAIFTFAGSMVASGGLTLLVTFIINRMAPSRPEAILAVADGFLRITLWGENGESTRRWPVAQIGSVKGNLYGMGLTIRVTGTDMIELLHRHPQDVRMWIAEELRAAIGIS